MNRNFRKLCGVLHYSTGYKLERTLSGIYPHPVDMYKKSKRHWVQEPLDSIKECENTILQKKIGVYYIFRALAQKKSEKKDLNKTK